MSGSLFLIVVTLFFVTVLAAGDAQSAIGKVVGVKQGAKLTSGGSTKEIRLGMEVDSGDTVTTDVSGVVQIIFVDETKIAVGPNARMVLDVSMMRGNRTAKNFKVKALGGSFRFISGKSNKSAYAIETPTATMGVRGTIFDLWVLDQRQSSLVILEGAVRMCGVGGRCKLVSGQCKLFATSPQGHIGRPADRRQAMIALNNGFPFISSQEVLAEPFQAEIGGCASLTEPPTQSETPTKAPDPVVAPPAAPTPTKAAAPPAPAQAPAGDPGPPSVESKGGDPGGAEASGNSDSGSSGVAASSAAVSSPQSGQGPAATASSGEQSATGSGAGTGTAGPVGTASGSGAPSAQGGGGDTSPAGGGKGEGGSGS